MLKYIAMVFANESALVARRAALFDMKFGNVMKSGVSPEHGLMLWDQAATWANNRLQFEFNSERFVEGLRAVRTEAPRNLPLLTEIAARIIVGPDAVSLKQLQAVSKDTAKHHKYVPGDAVNQLLALQVIEQIEPKEPALFKLTQICMMTMVDRAERVGQFLSLGIRLERYDSSFQVSQLRQRITDTTVLDMTSLDAGVIDNS